MNPKNKKIIGEIIDDDLFEEYYDESRVVDQFNGLREFIKHKKENGYFYPDDDDDELIIDEEYNEDEESYEYKDKLRKVYNSYYDIVVNQESGEEDE